MVVVDYWKLNFITKKDRYPLPRINYFLLLKADSITSLRWTSQVAIKNGSFAIQKKKCALISRKGLFETTRMTLGLCNAPVTFQRAMNDLLGDLKMSCDLV